MGKASLLHLFFLCTFLRLFHSFSSPTIFHFILLYFPSYRSISSVLLLCLIFLFYICIFTLSTLFVRLSGLSFFFPLSSFPFLSFPNSPFHYFFSLRHFSSFNTVFSSAFNSLIMLATSISLSSFRLSCYLLFSFILFVRFSSPSLLLYFLPLF